MSDTGVPTVGEADALQALETLVARFLDIPVDFSDLPVAPDDTVPERADEVKKVAERAAKGDFAGAWQEAVPLPDGFEEEYLRGKLLLAMGRIKEATRSLSRAVTAFASYGEAWFLLGVCRYRLGLFTDAAQCFLTAVRMNPQHQDAIALWNLAQTVYHRIDQSLNPEAQSVLPLVTDGIVGLDIGCGPRKSHPALIGVDLIAPGALGEKASVKGQVSAADLQASGDDLTMYADGSVDLIIARHNLEHYLDPMKALQEWRRVLRPGGVMALVLPDDEQFDTIHADETHLHTFTMDSIDGMVELVGGFRPVWLGASAPLWSFCAVYQKEGGTPFGYAAAVNAYRGGDFAGPADPPYRGAEPPRFQRGEGARRIALFGGNELAVASLAAEGATVVPLPSPDGHSGRWMLETLLREEAIDGIVTIGFDPTVSRIASFVRLPLVTLAEQPSADPRAYSRKSRFQTTTLATSRPGEAERFGQGSGKGASIPPMVDPFFFAPFDVAGVPFPLAVVASFDPSTPSTKLAQTLAPVVERETKNANALFSLARAFGKIEEGEGSLDELLIAHAVTLRDARLSGPWLAAAAATDRAARRGLVFLEKMEGIDVAFFTAPPPDERRNIYRLASITLIPPGDDSRIDPVLPEVMAVGGVAALPDTPLYRSVATDDEALFYPPDDPTTTVALLQGLLDDKRRRSRMGATARKIAPDRFSPASRWIRVMALLEGELN